MNDPKHIAKCTECPWRFTCATVKNASQWALLHHNITGHDTRAEVDK